MNNKDNCYCVYLHTIPREITNYDYDKYYVGMTKEVKRRWSRNGENYKACPAFYKAIQKYGWENIKHEILTNNLTKEEAEELEIYYIKKYNSLISQDGYNVNRGGYLSKPGRQVAFYNKDGSLWKIYNDINEVSLQYNLSTDTLRSYIKYGRLINGRKAIFVKDKILEKIETPISRAVEQYDLNGNFIREWDDGYEASEYYSKQRKGNNIATMVNKVCLGYRTLAYGFQWKYKDDPKEILDVSDNYVLMKNGTYITKYAQYYHNHKKTIRKTPPVNIYKYDLTGKYIKEYHSYKNAYNEYENPNFSYNTFTHILRNRFLKGSFKEYKGFIWTNTYYEKIETEEEKKNYNFICSSFY